MILLDTDSFSLHQVGHERFMERFQAASEAPELPIITQIEALRGRHDALLKAEDGARCSVPNKVCSARRGILWTKPTYWR